MLIQWVKLTNATDISSARSSCQARGADWRASLRACGAGRLTSGFGFWCLGFSSKLRSTWVGTWLVRWLVDSRWLWLVESRFGWRNWDSDFFPLTAELANCCGQSYFRILKLSPMLAPMPVRTWPTPTPRLWVSWHKVATMCEVRTLDTTLRLGAAACFWSVQSSRIQFVFSKSVPEERLSAVFGRVFLKSVLSLTRMSSKSVISMFKSIFQECLLRESFVKLTLS